MNFLASILVFVFLIISLVACRSENSNIQVDAPSVISLNGLVPDDWRSINTDNFSLALPPEMKGRKYQGDDSSGWVFESKAIKIFVEESIYAGIVPERGYGRDLYESSLSTVAINGVFAQILTEDLHKPNLKNFVYNADGSTKIEMVQKNKVMTAYFKEQMTTFSISSTSEVADELKKLILSTIRFK